MARRRRCIGGVCARPRAQASQIKPPSFVNQSRITGPGAATARADVARRQNEPVMPMAQQQPAAPMEQMQSVAQGMQPIGVMSSEANDPRRSGLARFFKGDPAADKFFSRYTPEQANLIANLLNFSQEQLADPGRGFEPIAQEARTRFQQEVVPSLAERFTGLGAGAQQSSGFAQILGKQGAELERGLAAEKGLYGQRQLGLLSPFLSGGLTQLYDYAYKPEGRGAFPSFLTAAAPGIGAGLSGAIAGGLLGGPAGALGGGLSGLSNLF